MLLIISAVDLIRDLLKVDVNVRISVNQAQDKPWIKEVHKHIINGQSKR